MNGFGETVGGWFGSSVVGKMLDMLVTYLGNNYALQSGTAEMVTSLKNSLPQIQYAIVEARKMPTKNQALIKWLDNLRNAADEVKDVLDDFEANRIRESFKKKNKVVESGKFIKALFLPDKESMELKSVEEKITKITGKIKDFLDHVRNEYSANAYILHTNTDRRETSSYLDPNSKIFGRDVEIYFILDMILNYQLMCFPKENPETSSSIGSVQESRGKRMKLEISNMESSVVDQNSVCIKNWKLPVLPICGLGGVGKTTVAQMVYNNEIVKEVFDQRAWVYVSEKFDVNTIMKKIVDLLEGTSSSSTNYSREVVERELKRTIEDRRFFLVLDDVHDRIELSYLFSVLSNGAPGSFILVTTQRESFAKKIENMSTIIKLDPLEPEWFDLLFKCYAFGELFCFDRESGRCLITCKNDAAVAQFINLREEELTDLESIASEIAKKLHGLPLAGRVIGKMLYSTLQKMHWEKFLKNDLWDDKKIIKKIIATLEIGYKELGPELQQCFKFCSIFPKHYVFDRNTLVQMWLAHEFVFVQSNEGESLIKLEDIGREMFDKLVERSFFQATVNDDKYVMHDLIRELAIFVSPKPEFYYVKSLNNKISSGTRHMGINCDGSNREETNPTCSMGINCDGLNREEINPIYSNLRTLILFGNWKNYTGELIRKIIVESKGLYLLDLSYVGLETIFPPTVTRGLHWTICKLRHLRFVDLSFSGIEFIPDEFCESLHLQMLDLRGCEFENLPEDMNKLTKLRHLYASAETVSKISGIGKLTDLQELKEFRVEKRKGHKIIELKDLNEISGHLTITNIENVSCQEEAATCQLERKRYLKSIELKLEGHSKVELEVLEALKPSPTVETLTIRGGEGDSLPGWMWSTQSGFSNLKYIKVINCVLTTLPAFGELPSLEILSFDTLRRVKMVGNEFYGRSDVVFPSLKELQFSGMSSWRTWSDAPAEKKSFPVLEKIDLHCNDLIEMPTNIFTSSVVEFTLSSLYGKFNNIETVLQRMPRLTHLSIAIVCNDLSINCTGLRCLKVLCLQNVRHICFIGGSKSLVNLKKLDIARFEEIRESFEEEEENDGTYQENRFLTSLILDSEKTQILPLAGRLGYLRSLLIRNSPVTEYTEDEESWFSQLTSLETLEFSSCWRLRGLPSTLPLLTKLKKLTIDCCPMITSLPESRLPRNLTELYIIYCSDELMRRCQREPDEGDDWWKISHIPVVQIKYVSKLEDSFKDFVNSV